MREFPRGLRDGIPIALGYFAVSFTFGIMGALDGLTWWQTVLISMTNMTSAGQFAGLEVMVAMGSYLEMALTELIINIRYSLMAISLSQNLDEKFNGLSRAILGFGITDEIFAVSAIRTKPVTRSYFLGLMTLPYWSWAGGTLCGVVLGSVLPNVVVMSLGIAIYGMFIAIVVPPAKKNRQIMLVSLVAIAISCLLYYLPVFSFVSSGFSIIICAVAASVVGALLFPIPSGENEVKEDAV